MDTIVLFETEEGWKRSWENIMKATEWALGERPDIKIIVVLVPTLTPVTEISTN
jgi:hypothetical protein